MERATPALRRWFAMTCCIRKRSEKPKDCDRRDSPEGATPMTYLFQSPRSKKAAPQKRGSFKKRRLLPVFPGGQILTHHQRYPEDNGVVELPQVETRQLADFLQPVDQGIPVNEQLPGSLGHV